MNSLNLKVKLLKESMIIRNQYVIGLIAFFQGLDNFSEYAVNYFFKDYLIINPSTRSSIQAIVKLPWVIRPLLGLLTDFCPIYGYRRKIYLFICGLINVISWWFMAYVADTTFLTTVLLFMINFCVAFSSVIGEAITVEMTSLVNEDKNQCAKETMSNYFILKFCSQLLTSFFKLYFIDIMSLRHIFLIASFLPLFIIGASIIFMEIPIISDKNNEDYEENNKIHYLLHKDADLLENEESLSLINNLNNNINNNQVLDNHFHNDEHIQRQYSTLVQCFYNKYFLIPVGFNILFRASPAFEDPMFYYLTNKLEFTATRLGLVAMIATSLTILALVIYKKYLKEISFKYLFIIFTLICMLLVGSYLTFIFSSNFDKNHSHFLLYLIIKSSHSFFNSFTIIPVFTLGCALTPKHIEATFYSLFMSSFYLGNVCSELHSGFYTRILGITRINFDNLYVLLSIATFYGLIPIITIILIDPKYFEPTKVNRIKSLEYDDKNNISEGEETADSDNISIKNKEEINENYFLLTRVDYKNCDDHYNPLVDIDIEKPSLADASKNVV